MKPVEVAKIVSDASRKELGLLYYSQSELEKIINEGRAIIIEENGRLAAFGCWTFRDGGWTEIHTLYVMPEFRGKGYLRKLFALAYERLKAKATKVFFFSQAPGVIKVAGEYGFKESSHFALPPKVFLKIILHRIKQERWRYYFKYAYALPKLFKFKVFVRG